MTLRYGSVCSGIEAASVAWEPLVWRPVFFSEIEPFPCEVLAQHYGANLPGEPHATNGVPNYGDMTTFREWPDADIDVLVGGTPCQAFSVAGLRKGLDDPRGNLTLVYLGLVERYRPEWVVWENVPGVLSIDGGRAFAAFLGGLAELGYGWAYRVLDAQFIRVDGHPRAVPQRRRRVFVVGHSSGDFRRAAAVLFEPESLRGDPPPGRETGQGVAPTISSRSKGGGGLGTDFECDGGLIPQAFGGGNTSGPVDSAACLTAKGQRIDFEVETFIAAPVAASLARGAEDAGKGGYAGLRADGFDASEDSTGRGTPIVPIAFAENSRAELRLCGGDGRVAPQLTTGGGKPGQGQPCIAYAIQERAVSESPNAGPDGLGVQADIAYTLEARQQVQGVAFDMRGREGGAQFEGPHETANIRAANGGSSRSYIATQWAVRRLTPTECERLQGFPDGYTDIPRRNGKPAADGPRYKALGNSMACNVMRWIGQRIQIAHEVLG